MASASEVMSPPPFTPGVSASASASVGSSWGVGLFLESLRAFFWALALWRLRRVLGALEGQAKADES